MSYEENNFNISKGKLRLYLTIIAGVVITMMLWSSVTVTIAPGYAGVLFRKFGGGLDKDNIYGEGFHILAPWNTMIPYEIRQQELFAEMQVLSSDQLSLRLDVTVLYNPVQSQIGYLHAKNGKGYEDKIIIPALRSVVRTVIARYIPEQINTSKRVLVENEIKEGVNQILADNFIKMQNILIRNIELPQTLKESIERKLKQQQESEEYEFRLEKETKEAERKRIEAQGIQDFQKIVNQTITEKLLRWNGIEATIELSKSPNTKVVVIGSGKDGLPLILGNN